MVRNCVLYLNILNLLPNKSTPSAPPSVPIQRGGVQWWYTIYHPVDATQTGACSGGGTPTQTR